MFVENDETWDMIAIVMNGYSNNSFERYVPLN